MLGLAYEIAVVIGCTSLRANSGVRVQRLRMTDRFLAMRVSFMCACLERLWMLLRLSRTSPLTTTVCRLHWGPEYRHCLSGSGLAEMLIDDSRYTYTPVILLSPDLYRVGTTMCKCYITSSAIKTLGPELSSPCTHFVISATEASVTMERGCMVTPLTQ